MMDNKLIGLYDLIADRMFYSLGFGIMIIWATFHCGGKKPGISVWC